MSNDRERVYEVTIRGNKKELVRNLQELSISINDMVIIEVERGLDIGKVTAIRSMKNCDNCGSKDALKNIKRIASSSDLERDKTNRSKEELAYSICEEEIAKLNLDMKLIEVEQQFDGSKTLFYFTADHRVDFRQLVKNLAAKLRTRIELRQIGVRDEAKRLDGIGVCGRQQCCSGFLPKFAQITTQHARDQQLSLNPSKISGNCGRLLCCLSYEEEDYLEAYKTLPRAGSKFTPEGKEKPGDVVFVDIFNEKIHVRTWEKGINNFEWYTKEEIGKGKIDEPVYENRREK